MARSCDSKIGRAAASMTNDRISPAPSRVTACRTERAGSSVARAALLASRSTRAASNGSASIARASSLIEKSLRARISRQRAATAGNAGRARSRASIRCNTSSAARAAICSSLMRDTSGPRAAITHS